MRSERLHREVPRWHGNRLIAHGSSVLFVVRKSPESKRRLRLKAALETRGAVNSG